MALQSCGSLTLIVSRLLFGSPGTKRPFGWGPRREAQRILYGEGDGFLRVWAVVSLVTPKLLVACPSTKGVAT